MHASPAIPRPAERALAPTSFWKLTLGSIGVVYGDIGTSPLYAFREAMNAFTGGAAAGHAGLVRADVLGVLSLILWALIIVVTIKYVVILLRADNEGEGGTLSLLALALRATGRTTPLILLAGAAGAALFYGDALITPAISVLSAVEGLKLVTSAADDYVVPITLAIIVALFLVQYRGTAAVSAWFGPITLLWFLAMGAGGLIHIAQDPAILAAIDPRHAVRFLAEHGRIGLAVLGAVFLVVTGAEALYADLGHFGRRPIQWAWIAVAFPALALNYLGQGALVLGQPEAVESPFYLLYPGWALVPMVVLASCATIIASQAVITGAYSLTRQAIQLKLLPRMKLLHTSAAQEGQIYIPSVNVLLLIGVVALVLAFGSSSRLASAYGIAVTGTMVLTCVLAIVALRHQRGWSLPAACALIAPFLLVDLVFLGANLMKVADGGYVPLLIAGSLVLLMSTWRKGRQLLAAKDREAALPLADMVERLAKSPPVATPGTAVYLTAHPDQVPIALLHSLKHFKVLHEQVVILTVRSVAVPRVGDAARIELERLDGRFTRIVATFGYMEEPDVPAALALCRDAGWTLDLMTTSFLMSRRTLRPAARSGMPVWQSRLFMFLERNAASPTEYFRLPAGRVVEVGAQMNV